MLLIQTQQSTFLEAMQRVAGIVERRNTLPILANVLIRKRGTTIELTTTDLELQVRTEAELGGDAADFTTTVAARKLVEILRGALPSQTVSLTAKDQRLVLQAGRSRFTLQTLPAHDFPLVREPEQAVATIEVPQAALKSLIDQVAFAMAVQDIRYFLNGVLFIVEGCNLTMVATDGNRLALAEAQVEAALPRAQVILPRRTVLELQRLLRESSAPDAAVQIRFAATQATFRFDGIEFVTKLIEGRFPDYQRVIPTANRHTLTLARAPLLEGLQRAAIMTTDKFRGIRLSLADDTLRIASSNAQHEAADEDIPVDYRGAPIEIGFNIGYLLDGLTHSSTDAVTLELEDAHSSVLFKFPGRDGFRYVVGPMRL